MEYTIWNSRSRKCYQKFQFPFRIVIHYPTFRCDISKMYTINKYWILTGKNISINIVFITTNRKTKVINKFHLMKRHVSRVVWILRFRRFYWISFILGPPWSSLCIRKGKCKIKISKILFYGISKILCYEIPKIWLIIY